MTIHSFFWFFIFWFGCLMFLWSFWQENHLLIKQVVVSRFSHYLIISVPLSMEMETAGMPKKAKWCQFRSYLYWEISLPSVVVVGLFGFTSYCSSVWYGFFYYWVPWLWPSFNLPQVTRNVEGSLKHVPFTTWSWFGAGLSRWETVLHVVIPQALLCV